MSILSEIHTRIYDTVRLTGCHQPLHHRAQPDAQTLRLAGRSRRHHRRPKQRVPSVGVNPLAYHKSVFRDLLKRVPWADFERLAARTQADHRVRRLSTKDQLIVLLFGQLSGTSSLCEIVDGLGSHASRLHHAGGQPVMRPPSPTPLQLVKPIRRIRRSIVSRLRCWLGRSSRRPAAGNRLRAEHLVSVRPSCFCCHYIKLS